MNTIILIITLIMWFQSCYYLSKSRRSNIILTSILLVLILWNINTEIAIIFGILGFVFSLIAIGNTFKQELSDYFRE